MLGDPIRRQLLMIEPVPRERQHRKVPREVEGPAFISRPNSRPLRSRLPAAIEGPNDEAAFPGLGVQLGATVVPARGHFRPLILLYVDTDWMQDLNEKPRISAGFFVWLARQDSNLDKECQKLLCYRYTTGQGDRVRSGSFRPDAIGLGPRDEALAEPDRQLALG
jgi:hypothetical protein